jgi:predicted PurR-regulated permease PerM
MEIEDYKKYSTVGIFIIIAVLAFFIIKPFLVSIIGALVLAYLFHPLFLKLKKYVKKDAVSAIIICAIIILAVIIPSLFIIKSLATQAIGAYTSSASYLTEQNTFGVLSDFEDKIGINIKLENILLSVASFFAESSKEFLASFPNKILNFLIMIFLLYYFLKEGGELQARIEKLIPLKKSLKEKIIGETKEVTRAVIYGSILTAIVQGIVGGIGFAMFGIPSPIFWGFLMAIFALIPMIGTGIIWAPAAIILFAEGLIVGDSSLIGRGIGLFIYGLLIIGLIDNFIKPKLIGEKSNIHPAIILIGIMGGLSFFGLIGIFLGPLILGLFITLIKVYGEEHGV